MGHTAIFAHRTYLTAAQNRSSPHLASHPLESPWLPMQPLPLPAYPSPVNDRQPTTAAIQTEPSTAGNKVNQKINMI
jgi:hypothetical protein